MYRLLKTENGQVEIVSATGGRDRILEWFKDYIFNHASNGEEYTPSDFDAVVEQGSEKIGSYEVSFDEVSLMKEDDFIARNGGVCRHCHSDDVEPGSLLMEDGYVSRELTCNICNETTTEQYTLAGYED